MAETREYKKPVAWLGGRDLLANLKNFILFAAYQGKLDPRDWMKAEIFPPPLPDPTDNHYEREKQYRADFNQSFNPNGKPDEFWFDYFADSGDGMTAGYAIAYLCLSDLTVNMPAGWEHTPPADISAAIRRDRAMAEIRSRFAALEAPARALPSVVRRILGDTPEGILKHYAKSLDPEILVELKRLSRQGIRQVIEYLEQTAIGVVNIPRDANMNAANCPLPRGAFLFVGGDTSYHVADFAGLGMRFQKVFDWAFADLKKRMNLSEPEAELKYWQESVRRPLFGVPGNHDYYDMIDGFNRQFAKPITRETNFINLDGRDMPPQLRLWPYKRFQTASYVAIKLPFGWWFWGVDSELPSVDIRQQEYFKRSFAAGDPDAAKLQVIAGIKEDFRRDFKREPTAKELEDEVKNRFPRIARFPHGDRWPLPQKLIVATSEPTTVEGKRARDDKKVQDKTAKAFSTLGLSRPFMFLPGTTRSLEEYNQALKSSDGEKIKKELAQFQVRLDISGDVHHYARYWGTDTGENEDAIPADNYSSIVSGGGGASMSPTQTDYAEVQEQTIYPNKTVSKRAVNDQLFRPWMVIRGGNVWLAGLIIGIIVVFGATSPGPHYNFTSLLISSNVSLHDLADSVNFWQIVKLVMLLILAGAGLVFAGLYISQLFTRLTKTHDWVRDKLENLRLAEKFKRGEVDMEASMRLEPLPTEPEAAVEQEYQSFLARGGELTSLDKERDKLSAEELKAEMAFENEYNSSEQLKVIYKRFLVKTETQKNPGITANRLGRFWLEFASHFLLISALWGVELLAVLKRISPEWHFGLFLVSWALALGNVIRTYYFAKSLTDQLKDIEDYRSDSRVRDFWQVIQRSVHPLWDYVPFWALLALPGLAVLILALWNYEKGPALPGFGNSVAIVFAILVASTAAAVANLYSGWLFQQAYRIKVNLFSYIPVMGLSAVALLTLVTAIVRCGRYEGRYLLTDAFYVTAVLAVFVGCIYLAFGVGNHLRKERRVWFIVLGLWHGLLQLLVPFMLVWFGNGLTLLAAFGAVLFFTATTLVLNYFCVDFLIRKVTLTLWWLAFSAVMVLLPLIIHRDMNGPWMFSRPVAMLAAAVLVGILTFALADRTTRIRLIATPLGALAGVGAMWLLYRLGNPVWATWLLAGLIGAVMSCAWVGWYFAVSLVFDGHANEAGSTARTEDYKHFIRFRLTEDSLTGFVIGIDFPYAPQNENEPDGSANKARLIDVFTLKAVP